MRITTVIGTAVGIIAAASASVISPGTVTLSAVVHGKEGPPFIVNVIANGVPLDGRFYRPTPDQQSQMVGLDLWIGASAAYSQLMQKELRIPFKLVPGNDHDSIDTARMLALKIQAEPRTLAVIGHGITATTRAAVPIYAQSQIPFLVALATADDAIKDRVHQRRYNSAFRLSPSDGDVQAPAIAYLISDMLQTNAGGVVHVFASDADGASEYSEPLCSTTDSILKANGISAEFSKIQSIPTAVSEIVSHHTGNDYVVFCGYPSAAIDFTRALDAASNAAPHGLPRLIVSDAAPDNLAVGIAHLRLYRVESLDTTHCTNGAALERIRAAAMTVDRKLDPEQIRGYDAVAVLAAATEKCSERLSRRCIVEQLGSGDTFPSACSDYSFRNGENIISDYYVFPEAQAIATGAASVGNLGISTALTLTAPEVLHMLRAAKVSPGDR